MQATDSLPDSKNTNYDIEFRMEIISQHIQLVTEMLQITEMLIKLETALQEVLP